MTDYQNPWPQPQSALYATLAARFRPIFAHIAEKAWERDRGRILPRAEIDLLKQAGYTAILLPPALGGAGADLIDLVGLQTELAAADSNVTQALRAHFGITQALLDAADTDWGRRWLGHVARGEMFASAYTEPGDARFGTFSTTLEPGDDGWRLDGRKYYTTGGLFAEWFDVSGRNGAQTARAVVATTRPGVTVLDDWDGFGQSLTASGTAIFDNVLVPTADIAPTIRRSHFTTAYAQISHLATLSGIGRAAVDAASDYVRARKRTYSHAAATRAADDPQVQAQIGQVRARVHAANVLTLAVAVSLDRVMARVAGGIDEAGIPGLVGTLEIEIYQAQVVVQEQVLEAITALFNALGASALSRELGWDRFWRNARAISSHNPVIYKERLIGDHAINGTLPPAFWIAGTA